MSKLPAKLPEPAPKLSEEDELALDEFCSEVSHDAVSFEEWERCHEDLEIIIPLYISWEDAQNGCQHTLKFSREISASNCAPKREKNQVTVTVPPMVQDGKTLLFEGMGSAYETNRGDLKVIIRIK